MGLKKSVRKLQRAAEQEQINRDTAKQRNESVDRHRADAEAAQAHAELTQPEHSKGRPLPDHRSESDKKDQHPPSNAGNDGA